jgi:hypothetical protein
LPRSRTDRPV